LKTQKNWLDTNVILRFLLDDHPRHSTKALELIKNAHKDGIQLNVTPFVLCETVYVLEGLEFERSTIVERLIQFSSLNSVQYTLEETMLSALIDYKETGGDFPDALLINMGRSNDETVWSFNKSDFTNFSGPWESPLDYSDE